MYTNEWEGKWDWSFLCSGILEGLPAEAQPGPLTKPHSTPSAFKPVRTSVHFSSSSNSRFQLLYPF